MDTPHAAGGGSKGRLYDWARIALRWVVEGSFERWVLIRRNRRDPQDRAYYLVFSPSGTELAELAGAAGLRWTIEECFQRTEELGLDHCEARSWHGFAPPQKRVACSGAMPRHLALGRSRCAIQAWAAHNLAATAGQ